MSQKDRHIRIRAERREDPDIRKLGKALIALAQAQAEKEAREQHDSTKVQPNKRTPRRPA